MIQIIPVNNDNTQNTLSEFFKGDEHFHTMEMQEGTSVMGKGSIYIKGHVAYLLSLEVFDQNITHVVVDSLLRGLMNLATINGAIIFNANEEGSIMGYCTKNEFLKLSNFTYLTDEDYFTHYVSIEPFFARPCKG